MSKIPWRNRAAVAQPSDNRKDESRGGDTEPAKSPISLLKLSGGPQINARIAKITALFEKKAPLAQVTSQESTVKPIRRCGESIMQHISVFERGSSDSTLTVGERRSSFARRRSNTSSGSCSSRPSTTPGLELDVTLSHSISAIPPTNFLNSDGSDPAPPTRTQGSPAATSKSESREHDPVSCTSLPVQSVKPSHDDDVDVFCDFLPTSPKASARQNQQKRASQTSVGSASDITAPHFDEKFRPRSSVVSRASLASLPSLSSSAGFTPTPTEPSLPLDMLSGLAVCSLGTTSSLPGSPPHSKDPTLSKSLSSASADPGPSDSVVKTTSYINACVFVDDAVEEHIRRASQPSVVIKKLDPESPLTSDSCSSHRDDRVGSLSTASRAGSPWSCRSGVSTDRNSNSTPPLVMYTSPGSRSNMHESKVKRLSGTSLDTDDESNIMLGSMLGWRNFQPKPASLTTGSSFGTDEESDLAAGLAWKRDQQGGRAEVLRAVPCSTVTEESPPLPTPSASVTIGTRAVGGLRKLSMRVKGLRLRSVDSTGSRMSEDGRSHARSRNGSSSDSSSSPIRRSPVSPMSSTKMLAYATLSGGEMPRKALSLYDINDKTQYTMPGVLKNKKSSDSVHSLPSCSSKIKANRSSLKGQKSSDSADGYTSGCESSGNGSLSSSRRGFTVPQLRMEDAVLPALMPDGQFASDKEPSSGLTPSAGRSNSSCSTSSRSDVRLSSFSLRDAIDEDDVIGATSNSNSPSSCASCKLSTLPELPKGAMVTVDSSTLPKCKPKPVTVKEILDRPVLLPEKLLPAAHVVKSMFGNEETRDSLARHWSDPDWYCPSVRGVMAAASTPALRPTSVLHIKKAASIANIAKTSLLAQFDALPEVDCSPSPRRRVFSDPTSQPVLMNVIRTLSSSEGAATMATSTSEPRLRTRAAKSLRRPANWGKCLMTRQKSIPSKYSRSLRRRTDGDISPGIKIVSSGSDTRRQTADNALQSVPDFADFARTECYQKRRASVSELALRKKQLELGSRASGQYLLLPVPVQEKSELMEVYADALWDYSGGNELELCFNAGDVLEILDRGNESWWWASNMGTCGYIPSNHVRVRAIQDEVTDVDESPGPSEVLKEEAGELLVPAAAKKKRRKSNIEMRACVVKEIMQTESDYVGHLEDIVEGYMLRAQERREFFDDDNVVIIFSNAMDLLKFQREFLKELKSAFSAVDPGNSMIGKVFANNQREFSIYSEYCNNHPYAVEEMTILQDNPQYKFFFEACRLIREMAAISLEGYLLTPVQKICKYPLQLSELLKYTPETHPDYLPLKAAREGMKQVALLINDRKARVEKLERLAKWRLEVSDWSGDDVLVDSTMIVHDGVLSRATKGTNQVRHYFLLDNQLICCKKDAITRKLLYRQRFMLSDCSIQQMDDNEQGLKHAWKIGHDEKTKTKWYVMQNRSEAERAEWMNAFQKEREQAHLDQYDPDMSSYLEKARRAVRISLKLGLEGTCRENSWDRSRLVSSGKRGPGKAPPGSKSPKVGKSPGGQAAKRTPSFLSRNNNKDWRLGSRIHS